MRPNLKNRIRRESPVPIYHQIAEAVRNAIAVGELVPGERLPAVRAAATEWGVNLHTVRRAYGELERDGLVRMNGARGTEVVGRGRGAGLRAGGEAAAVADGMTRGSLKVDAAAEVDEFLAAWVRAARERYGLGAEQLGRALLRGVAGQGIPRVHFIECSRAQAEGHCEELMEAWRVEASPLVLSEAGRLPEGVLVGTYFHYNDIRQRWPERLDEIRFVAIAPDPALVAELGPRTGARTRLLVCELDEAKAVNIAADLRALFPADRWAVEPCVPGSTSSLPRRSAGVEVLVSPRVWGALTDAQRKRVVHIRYRIRAQELASLGASYGWDRNERSETR